MHRKTCLIPIVSLPHTVLWVGMWLVIVAFPGFLIYFPMVIQGFVLSAFVMQGQQN